MTPTRIADVLGRDVRFAVRMLARTPSFAIASIATLALVIGANTAVFSLIDAILLRPLPYPEPDRLALVAITTLSPRGEYTSLAQDGVTWEAIRDHAASLPRAVFTDSGGGVNLVVGKSAVHVRQQRVGAGFFSVLGVPPRLGREFTADEDRPGGAAVAILSHALWSRMFQGDPDVLGRSILLRGEPYQVVGLMPEGFRSTLAADLWTPLRASTTGEGGGSNYQIVVRVPSRTPWPAAEAGLGAAGVVAFEKRGSGRDVTTRLSLTPLREALVGDVRRPLVMLGSAAGLVLLIACVNLAGLLLARSGGRTREVATRMALGAGGRVVVRQLMVESVLLALVGGTLGVMLGQLGLQGLKAIGGQTFPEWQGAAIDLRVLAVTAALSFLTSVCFGLVPALQTVRLDVRTALCEGGSRGVAGGSRHWLRRGLVTAEVALGVVLLVAAGLLLRTFVGLRGLEPGFDPKGLVAAGVSLQDARYASADRVNGLFDDSLARLRGAPGVEGAAVSLELPYERLLNLGFRFAEQLPGSGSNIANVSYVSPGFFATLRLPLRRGRLFSESDREGAPLVVVVNDAFVRIYVKEGEALGRRIALSGQEREIVGVVGDVQQRGAGFMLSGMTPGPLTTPPVVYLPAHQTSDAFVRLVHTWFNPVWTVRAASPRAGAEALRRALAEADPLLPIASVRGMSELQAAATAQPRLLMTLVSALAGAAILLAAIGIHGLVAHAVAERERELGIRMALGATPARTIRDVALPGIALSLAGALLGGILSLSAARLVRAFLWGVSPHDVATYAGASLFLLTVAVLSSLVPALRILRLDPAATLRR